MDRVQQALAAFQSGFHCTQAVLLAFCEDLGLDAPTASRLAECFGGAVCNRGMPCGALLGASMVLGLYAGRSDPDDAEAKVRCEAMRAQLYAAFSARSGAADCQTLLGCDITTPQGMQDARASGAMLRCGDYVALCAELTDRLLREEPAESPVSLPS